jgi:hypothetical protein
MILIQIYKNMYLRKKTLMNQFSNIHKKKNLDFIRWNSVEIQIPELLAHCVQVCVGDLDLCLWTERLFTLDDLHNSGTEDLLFLLFIELKLHLNLPL